MQQAMRVEGVVDVAAPVHAELETQGRAACADRFAVLRRLFGADPVFAGQVFDRVLAFGRHLRIQLERLEMQFDLQVPANARHSLLQRLQAHRAPRAGDIGNEIDLDRNSHGNFIWMLAAKPRQALNWGRKRADQSHATRRG